MRGTTIINLVLAGLLAGPATGLALELRDVTYQTANAGTVTFSHGEHMRKKPKRPAVRCATCHESKAGTARANMAAMAKGKSCGACHNGKQAFALEQCLRCHKASDVTYQVAATGPVNFSHQRHLGRAKQCSACHNSLYQARRGQPVGMAAMAKGKSCGACHNGKQAFAIKECAGCHPNKQQLVFPVTGLAAVPFSHKRHQEFADCTGCHPAVFLPGANNRRISMSEMEKGASCGSCHDGKQAFSVAGSCEACHTIETKAEAPTGKKGPS